MTRILGTLLPVVITVTVLGALTGCTPVLPGSPAPSGSASTPSAIITGSAADTSEPQPVLNIDCPGLVDSTALAGAFPAGVHSVDPLVTQGSLGPDIQSIDVVQAAGGITCEWNNGLPMGGSPDGDSQYVGLQLAVLPRAATGWTGYAAAFPAGVGFQCNSTTPALNCWSEQLVGTTWVSLTMFGVGGQTEARTLTASINSAVSSATAGAPAWTPPSGTKAFGDCTQLLTPAQVATDLGVTDVGIEFSVDPIGGVGFDSTARTNADAVGCEFQYTGQDESVGQVHWLRGGSWAYDRSLAAVPAGWGVLGPATIAGLAAGDRAKIRCNAPDPAAEEFAPVCAVDLLLGGNWIQVLIEPSPYDPYFTANPRSAALAIAAHLVSGFNAHAH